MDYRCFFWIKVNDTEPLSLVFILNPKVNPPVQTLGKLSNISTLAPLNNLKELRAQRWAPELPFKLLVNSWTPAVGIVFWQACNWNLWPSYFWKGMPPGTTSGSCKFLRQVRHMKRGTISYDWTRDSDKVPDDPRNTTRTEWRSHYPNQFLPLASDPMSATMAAKISYIFIYVEVPMSEAEITKTNLQWLGMLENENIFVHGDLTTGIPSCGY